MQQPLLPALVLGVQGNYVYKRESFDLTRDWFNDEQWSVIEWASDMRKKWPVSTFSSTIIRNTAKLGESYRYIEYLTRRLRFDNAKSLHIKGLYSKYMKLADGFAERCQELAEESYGEGCVD